MKVIAQPRFNVGDEIYEVYRDGDIDAWNVCSWKIAKIKIIISTPYPEQNQWVEYYSDDGSDYGVRDSDDIWPSSYSAAKDARQRNQLEKQVPLNEYKSEQKKKGKKR